MDRPHYYGLADSVLDVTLHEPSARHIPETLLHDVWLHQRFNAENVETVGGIPVAILDPGRLNPDSGPDFLGARLKLGSTSWSGSVEIHITSGGWLDHHHDRDPLYNSTLLHVVLEADIWTGKLRREDGTLLPEVVLHPHLSTSLRKLLHSFYSRSESRIPCASSWGLVPETVRSAYFSELAEERLTEKSRRFVSAADRETCLYEGLFAALGYSKNAAPMRTLSRIVSLGDARAQSEPLDVEALYLGASGLLPRPAALLDADRETADYVMGLSERFQRLNQRLEINPMPVTAWRFFRLRPANFPPLRIAQAAALLYPETGFLSDRPLEKLEEAIRRPDPLKILRGYFRIRLDSFWQDHVRLERRTARRSPSIGLQRTNALLVNVILPALYSCGPQVRQAALELLKRLPPTEDEITREFAPLGTRPGSEEGTQALHQLYRTRCSEARCLSCTIGRYLLEAPT